jgi:hypothetical protein
VFDFRIEGCTIKYGSQAIACSPAWGGYTVRIRDCKLAGLDCAIEARYGRVIGEGLSVVSTPTVYRGIGTQTAWRDIEVGLIPPGSPVQFAFLDGTYGGTHALDQVVIDNEGSPVPADGSAILCENHYSMATILTLRNVFFGTQGGGALVRLRDQSSPVAGRSPARIYTEGLSISGLGFSAVYAVDGPGWIGTVQPIGPRNQVIQFTPRWGAATGLTLEP